MIITENLTLKEKEYIKYTSDSGYYIQCEETGELFAEAVDLASVTGRTYMETMEAIPQETEHTPNIMSEFRR